MLPADVLKQAQQELCDWNGLGTSVMEISHRGKEFIQVAEEAEKDFRDLLNIPSNYKVLFCHGGGRGQFAGVPLNILGDKTTADYVDAGYWAASAVKEAHKYCTPNVIDAKVTVDGLRAVKPMSEWQLSDNAAYLHYCPNETIDGIAIDETPDFGSDKVVVADFSSTILSAPIDVSRYGVIYAGAQKNIGPAGLTLVIVREDLLGKAQRLLPVDSRLHRAERKRFDVQHPADVCLVSLRPGVQMAERKRRRGADGQSQSAESRTAVWRDRQERFLPQRCGES